MTLAALIPVLLIFCCFVFLRWSLIISSSLALAACVGMNIFLWQATPASWLISLTRAGETLFEIGFILVGAFLFLETSEAAGLLKSLADLVKKITHIRILQGLLVSFPLAMMVEGSSGFGTPILVIIPILRALDFPLKLCALLPFVNVVSGIPFGALGTPLRLGFPNAHDVSFPIVLLSLPFLVVGPLLSGILITQLDPVAREQSKKINPVLKVIWILSVSFAYMITSYFSSHLGPEFPSLAGGIVSFCVGLLLIRILGRWDETHLEKLNLKGIISYSLLLLGLWGGKRFWMDQMIPHTHIRIFNPGWIFLIFSLAIILYERISLKTVFGHTFQRGKRTLWVLFCMTTIVQILRNNGSLESLTLAIPLFLKEGGAGILGWFGTIGIGTSTMTNLLFSKIVEAPFHPLLAMGSAIGVQVSFQSIVATCGVLNNKINERQMLKMIVPLSIGYVLLLSAIILLAGV